MFFLESFIQSPQPKSPLVLSFNFITHFSLQLWSLPFVLELGLGVCFEKNLAPQITKAAFAEDLTCQKYLASYPCHQPPSWCLTSNQVVPLERSSALLCQLNDRTFCSTRQSASAFSSSLEFKTSHLLWPTWAHFQHFSVPPMCCQKSLSHRR